MGRLHGCAGVETARLWLLLGLRYCAAAAAVLLGRKRASGGWASRGTTRFGSVVSVVSIAVCPSAGRRFACVPVLFFFTTERAAAAGAVGLVGGSAGRSGQLSLAFRGDLPF